MWSARRMVIFVVLFSSLKDVSSLRNSLMLECKRRASHTDLFTPGTHAVWALKFCLKKELAI